MVQIGSKDGSRGEQACSKSVSKLTLVAEKPTPPLLAVTLPRLLAGAMEAARVTDAVITVTPAKAHTTPKNTKII